MRNQRAYLSPARVQLHVSPPVRISAGVISSLALRRPACPTDATWRSKIPPPPSNPAPTAWPVLGGNITQDIPKSKGANTAALLGATPTALHCRLTCSAHPSRGFLFFFFLFASWVLSHTHLFPPPPGHGIGPYRYLPMYLARLEITTFPEGRCFNTGMLRGKHTDGRPDGNLAGDLRLISWRSGFDSNSFGRGGVRENRRATTTTRAQVRPMSVQAAIARARTLGFGEPQGVLGVGTGWNPPPPSKEVDCRRID